MAARGERGGGGRVDRKKCQTWCSVCPRSITEAIKQAPAVTGLDSEGEGVGGGGEISI